MTGARPRAVALLAVLVATCAPHPIRPTIHLRPISSVHLPDGAAGLSGRPSLSPELPAHRRIAWTDGAASALVLDSTGSVAGRFAAKGGIRAVLRGAGDTVVVVADGTISLYDRDLHLVRSFAVPPGPIGSAAKLANGWFALAPATVGPARSVLLVDRAGRRVGALRSLDPTLATLRAVAPGAESTIWTAQLLGRLEFDRFDTTGRAIELIPLGRDWFPPRLALDRSPPSARVVGFWHGDQDRFWLVAAVPHAEAGLGLEPAEAVDSSGGGATDDGVIEVTDPVETTVVASARFDGGFDQVVEPGIVTRSRRDAGGGWVVTVYQVEMR